MSLVARFALALGVGGALGGCAAPLPRAQPVAPLQEKETSDDAAAPWLGARLERVTLRSQQLALDFPAPRRWAWKAKKPGWTEAMDPHSGARFRLRGWRTGRRASFDDCARDAELWAPELVAPRDEALAIDERLESSHALHGRIHGWLLGEGQRGRVVLFAVWPGRCLLAAFEGAGASVDATAEQLSVFAEQVFPSFRRLSPDARVGRETVP
jgi:hypothetical protein